MADVSAAEMPPGALAPNPSSGNATAGVAADTTSLSASVEGGREPPGPSAVGGTTPAEGSQPAGLAHDSATQFSSAGEGTGGSSAALPSAGSSISAPPRVPEDDRGGVRDAPPVGAASEEGELSAAEVHYFAETLRQWHGRTDTPRCPSAGAFRRHSVGGKPRGIPLQLSAPVGGSAGMRGAAAKEKKQKKEEEEEQPLLAQGGGGAAPRGRAAGAGAGAVAGEGTEGAGEFDYGKLRGVLTGLAKDVLVELWIEQHIRTELGGMDLKLEFTLHLLGLKGAANTIVGSRTVRGVSGGERHRVTTAEMMSGMFVVMAFDEISTGLDSSATYDIVSAIRTIARVRRTTNAFSLLQPPPEVFNLFDRVIVLSEGSIVYQGPRADVLAYFEGLGYRKPPHVDVADFIQEIPTESGVEFVAPGATHLSTAQLVEAYHSSAHYRDVMRVVQGEQ
ncbi:unnamed protein product, partial [Closterium sp. NIES-54]